MKALKITFYGPVEPNAEGHLTRPIVLEQVLPLEAVEEHGMMVSPGTPMGLSQAQMFELKIYDASISETVGPQGV